MSVINITKANYDEIKNGDKVVLIDFYADWCGPCRMMAPVVHEIAEENENIVVGKINVDDEPALAQEYGVMSIPTLVVLKGGKEVTRATGARPKAQVLAMLDK
ncbi:MAG: thioredoxin [Clostridia bacterium]|nr:thioredoxin [Clostridia bacterium]